MKNEFKDWLAGMLFFLFITASLYHINKWVSPYNYYSMLEWYGIVMLIVVIKTGLDSWNNEE